MNAVGIDVSKCKSMVAALRPMGEVALTPREFPHTELGLEQMANAIIGLGEETRVSWKRPAVTMSLWQRHCTNTEFMYLC